MSIGQACPLAQIGIVAVLDATVIGVMVARHFLPGGIERLHYQPTYIGLGEIGRDTHLVSVLTICQNWMVCWRAIE